MSWTVFKHYLKRASRDPLGMFIFLVFPLVLVTIFVLINQNEAQQVFWVDGFDPVAMINTLANIFLFALIGGTYSIDYIFSDFKSDRHFRLFSTPMSRTKFIFSMAVASSVIILVQLSVVLVVSYVAFNVYWGNWFIVVPTMFIVILMGQFIGIIVSYFIKKKGTAEAVMVGISWGVGILSGMLINVEIPVIGNFIANYFPIGAAINLSNLTSIFEFQTFLGITSGSSPAPVYALVLLGTTIALGVISFIFIKRKPL